MEEVTHTCRCIVSHFLGVLFTQPLLDLLLIRCKAMEEANTLQGEPRITVLYSLTRKDQFNISIWFLLSSCFFFYMYLD